MTERVLDRKKLIEYCEHLAESLGVGGERSNNTLERDRCLRSLMQWGDLVSCIEGGTFDMKEETA